MRSCYDDLKIAERWNILERKVKQMLPYLQHITYCV